MKRITGFRILSVLILFFIGIAAYFLLLSNDDKKQITPPTYTIETHDVQLAAWSPDSRMIALAHSNGEVSIWRLTNLKTSELLHVLPISNSTNLILTMDWHPNENLLAVADGREITVWDVTTGERVITITGHTGNIHLLRWSQDGKRLASSATYPDWTTRIWDIISGENLFIFQGTSIRLDWIQNDSYLMGELFEGASILWNIVNGEVETELCDGIVNPDDTKFICAIGILELFDLPSGELLVQARGGVVGNLPVLAWNPTGTRIASAGELADRNTITVWDSDGRHLKTFEKQDSQIFKLVWIDANQLVSISFDGAVNLWNAEQGAVSERLVLPPISNAAFVAVSHENSKLALVSENNVMIWNLPN